MPHILLVDDEAMLRRTLRTMLESAGHTVAEAEDGKQAMEMFVAETFDLVITDIIMPNREGIETVKALREIDARLPIIAISGGGSTGGDLFLKLAAQMGANRTLAKPIRQAELLEALEACLGKSGAPG